MHSGHTRLKHTPRALPASSSGGRAQRTGGRLHPGVQLPGGEGAGGEREEVRVQPKGERGAAGSCGRRVGAGAGPSPSAGPADITALRPSPPNTLSLQPDPPSPTTCPRAPSRGAVRSGSWRDSRDGAVTAGREPSASACAPARAPAVSPAVSARGVGTRTLPGPGRGSSRGRSGAAGRGPRLQLHGRLRLCCGPAGGGRRRRSAGAPGRAGPHGDRGEGDGTRWLERPERRPRDADGGRRPGCGHLALHSPPLAQEPVGRPRPSWGPVSKVLKPDPHTLDPSLSRSPVLFGNMEEADFELGSDLFSGSPGECSPQDVPSLHT